MKLTEEEFAIFRDLILQVCQRINATVKEFSDIHLTESKFEDIADDISESIVAYTKIRPLQKMISPRSLREFSRAVIKNKNEGISPSIRLIAILCRYASGKEPMAIETYKEWKAGKFKKEWPHYIRSWKSRSNTTKGHKAKLTTNSLEIIHKKERGSMLEKNNITKNTETIQVEITGDVKPLIPTERLASTEQLNFSIKNLLNSREISYAILKIEELVDFISEEQKAEIFKKINTTKALFHDISCNAGKTSIDNYNMDIDKYVIAPLLNIIKSCQKQIS